MHILFVCHYSALTGFGRAARDYAAALTIAGHDVQIVDWRSYPDHPDAPGPPPTAPELRDRALDARVQRWPTTDVPPPDVVVAHGQASLLANEAVYETVLRAGDGVPVAAMTTWETDSVPGPIADGLTRYEHLIVPSRFTEAVFDREFAIEGPTVHVVPHCFDPAYWVPHGNLERYGAQRLGATTRFYTHGAWSERKNHLAVVRAYLHAFTVNDPVDLLIASQGLDDFAIRSTILRSGRASGIPEIQTRAAPLEHDELLHLHDANDVFVTATRGEGWGLPIFEAALMGKTIIAPDHGGHVDFLRDDTFPGPDPGWRYAGWRPVGHRMVPCFAGEPKMIVEGGRPVGMKASVVPGMDCTQTWAEPDVLELAAAMRAVYAQRVKGNSFVQPRDRAVLERRFGYAAVAQRLIDTLQETISS